MNVLRPIELMNILQMVIATQTTLKGIGGSWPTEVRQAINTGANTIIEIADELELPVTSNTARIMVADAKTPTELKQGMLQLGNTLFMELNSRKFYGPLERFTKYFEPEQLFGTEVFNAFPSANDDIFEAGTCLALERATACVMHLNRALECGLAALAKAVGVAKQNDWGRYLREINKELDGRAKAAGARSIDEQFYAEAAANFDRLRVAYRNPTMHPDRIYSQDRAEEILLATKSFMAHLATRISE